MKVQKSKIVFLSVASVLLLLSFQNCGRQLVTISSDSPGYQDQDIAKSGDETLLNEEPILKTEVRISPMIMVEGKAAKVSFTMIRKIDRPVEVILKPVSELAQEYVNQKLIVTRYIFPAGTDSIELSLPILKLPNYNNLKIEFEVNVADEKFATVSTKSFNIYVVPAHSAEGAASIVTDDQVTAGGELKGSIVLLSKTETEAAIDWELQGPSDDLKLLPVLSGRILIPSGQQFVNFSIPTSEFANYQRDKSFTLKFSNEKNVKLVEDISKNLILIDQKPHSAPVFTKSLASMISKDFKNGAKLTVHASGIPAPVFEWYVNGQLVNGSAAEYVLPPPTEPKQFVVRVNAKNIYGVASTQDATIAFGCANNETLKTGICEVNTVKECAIAYGTGQQTWMTDRWSDCLPVSCNTGFIKLSQSCGCPTGQHLQDSKCVNNSMVCPIENGSGAKTWNGKDYGPCTLVSCNSSFSAFGNLCACQADQTLDVTDNLCKYKVRKWLLMASYDSIGIPVRCSGSYKPFSRPVNGVYNVSGIIIAGASPWLDPHAVDPNFSVSVMRVIETSTCGGEFLDGGYPGTNTLCYSRNCAMKMYRAGEGLSLTK